MPRPFPLPCARAGWLVTSVLWCAAAPAGADEPRARDLPGSPRALVAAVNAIADADIPLDAAQCAECPLDRLPGSRAALLPLLPTDHRKLLEECARGRMRVQRDLSGFDLVALIEHPARRPAAEATIRAFFDNRGVDVACGTACSAEPYPISFDWAVVLDRRSHTLFSFVLNCRD